jgi:hypothetical protein
MPSRFSLVTAFLCLFHSGVAAADLVLLTPVDVAAHALAVGATEQPYPSLEASRVVASDILYGFGATSVSASQFDGGSGFGGTGFARTSVTIGPMTASATGLAGASAHTGDCYPCFAQASSQPAIDRLTFRLPELTEFLFSASAANGNVVLRGGFPGASGCR